MDLQAHRFHTQSVARDKSLWNSPFDELLDFGYRLSRRDFHEEWHRVQRGAICENRVFRAPANLFPSGFAWP